MNPQFVTISGHRIRLVDQGEGNPLLLLHGIGGSLEWWEPNIPVLSRRFRVIAVDFLGFGFSDKPRLSYNLEMGSRFIRSLLDTLGISRVCAAGNSMGGLIALNAAVSLPERIDKLILVDNAGFGKNISIYLRLGTIPFFGETALFLRNRFTVRFFLSRIFYDSKKIPDRLVNTVVDTFRDRRTRQVFLKVLRYGVGLRGINKHIQEKIEKGSSGLRQKTLIVWGTKDKVIPMEQAEAGKKLIPDSRLFFIKNCGHSPQLECPEEFNRLVLNFLEK